jgi:hypothetical protein
MLRARILMAAARCGFLFAGVLSLASCESRPFVGAQGTPSFTNGTQPLALLRTDAQRPFVPEIRQNGHSPQTWRMFNAPAGSKFVFMQADPNGKYMWLSDAAHSAMVRVTMDGTFTSYPLSSASGTFTPAFFTFGGSKIYVGGCAGSTCNLVGIFAPKTGQFQVISIASGDGPGAKHEFTYGPDKNVWFTETSHVAKITPQGVVTEYAAPTYVGQNIVAANGNIWFDGASYDYGCEESAYGGTTCPWVTQINPGTGNSSEYYLGVRSGAYFQAFAWLAGGMTVGPDGNVYVLVAIRTLSSYGAEFRTYMDELDGSGDQTTYALREEDNGWTQASLTTLPDGDLWWGANLIAKSTGVVQWDPVAHHGKTHPNYYENNALVSAAGRDGNYWAIDSKNNIIVYINNVLTVSPTSLTLDGPKDTGTLTVTYTGTGKLRAMSLNGNVARVASSGSLQYTVRALRAGSTQIIVQDNLHNSFSISVKVK